MSPEEKKPSYNDADFDAPSLLESIKGQRVPEVDNREKGPRMNLKAIAAEQENL